jgi:hypothetical protein
MDYAVGHAPHLALWELVIGIRNKRSAAFNNANSFSSAFILTSGACLGWADTYSFKTIRAA